MIKEIFTGIEKFVLGSTWATETMTPSQRLRFYRDTGEWPGLHSKAVLEMVMQGDIDAERNAGKDFCAKQKLARAKEAGLNIK